MDLNSKKTRTVALAELLLRRKELHVLVSTRTYAMQNLRDRLERTRVSEEYDQVSGLVSAVDPTELERELNFYAHQRRLADSVVQQANWTTEVEVPRFIMEDESNLDATPAMQRVNVKLAELLVRRKELDEKPLSRGVDLSTIGPRSEQDGVWHKIDARLGVSEGMDVVTKGLERKAPVEVPAFQRVDDIQHRLRLLDKAVQKANWKTEVEVDESVFRAYHPNQ